MVIFIIGRLYLIMSITKEQIALLLYIKNMLADLIYINGIIATELIKVTENTAIIRRGEEFLNTTNCQTEHKELNEQIIKIVKKYINNPPGMNLMNLLISFKKRLLKTNLRLIMREL